MRIGITGDIHGAWGSAEDVLEEMITEHGPFDLIINVGDMNFGMAGVRPWEYEPPCRAVWVCGNHENYDLLNKRDQSNFGHDPYHVLWPRAWEDFLKRWEYMPRGTVEDGILYIGGASTPPWFKGKQGINWWSEENIAYEDEERTLEAIEAYDGPIHTVISHDCPTSFVMESVLWGEEYHDNNRKFLEHIRQLIMPERWYFGHYHAPLEGDHEGCHWRCIDQAGSARGIDYAVLEI